MKNGYTLMELLMGIAITAVVFTIGTAGFREFSRRQILEGVAKTAKTNLRLAQSLALTGQKPNTGTCTQLDGYTFSIVPAQSYEIIANCIDNPNLVIKQIELPTGITISGTSIQFKVLGSGTNLSVNSIITFTSSLTGNSNFVTVDKGGSIE